MRRLFTRTPRLQLLAALLAWFISAGLAAAFVLVWLGADQLPTAALSAAVPDGNGKGSRRPERDA